VTNELLNASIDFNVIR